MQGFRGLGLRAEGSGFRGSGFGVRVEGLGFRGLGFRVQQLRVEPSPEKPVLFE